uniref:Uncharacterized protein n=1 Tax=Strombidinopsis acuminata TaxID=141414 RepID=A0A7S3W976_9SPIT|mmetsp:Transcript_2102/g.2578  ORF Transcript_2102/g.2578 Transcript_2102/m.2578 type:complete len:324 (+) Transcript_2102:45-1016(+)|eukprot:CAMPEP_0176376592 /NCGR_PEP_ID=MMETSP0126-20121128/28310_1 /TAXON_ID=141414 ORGANISM="Strombidinopsis acuminatum, Strain SPMC142" /NCGR_SAMPLE_ID=MMETSP0126 /ASSEMBLY_ACC=CAM_ASM_000229 /LENGTH=323 /DNA_ID=CAMNT_0017738119 /DNA_START=48 /DNA_END=1019 /DNA_ORIENTATION=+
MKTFFATLACAAAASSDDTMRFWKWAIEHGRNYQSEEELEHRFINFMRTEAEVDVLNSLGHDATYAVNTLSDYTKEEYRQMLGYVAEEEDAFEVYNGETDDFYYEEDASDNSTSVDWRSKGAVTGVKNQGSCGSCWSFSSTGAMEGAHHKKTGKLVSLSEQQLVDCNTKSHGCNGGNQGSSFSYAESHPLETESSYPYKGKDGSCKYDSSKGKVKVSNYSRVSSKSSSALKSAISNGPVAVTVEADKSVFQNYSSGVVCSGCGTSLDHAVLAVGYGTENGKGYYLVKNSWGTRWGSSGYIKIGITDGAGCCGIQLQSYSVSTN